jgi:hypothetical protein
MYTALCSAHPAATYSPSYENESVRMPELMYCDERGQGKRVGATWTYSIVGTALVAMNSVVSKKFTNPSAPPDVRYLSVRG